MKNTQYVTLLVLSAVLTLSVVSFAVGELIGLRIQIQTEDGMDFIGLVTGETESTITINVDGDSINIQRNAIKSISLLDGTSDSSQSNGDVTLSDDPAFAEVRRAALRKAALWQISQSGVQAVQAWLNYLVSKGEPEENRSEIIYTKVGVGIAGVVLNLVLQPNLEERLYWRSQLPAWHGIVGLIGGMANLGAGVSLALGYVQKYAAIDELDPAETWFDRSAMLFLVKGASDLIHVFYAGSQLAPTE